MSAHPGKARKRVLERRQRRYPRYRAEFPVTLTLFSGNEHKHLDGHCRDLSQAGIGVLIASELAVGEVMSLSFTLPGVPEPWNLRAVLRCRRGYHYGFEFLSLSAQQLNTLAEHVSNLERADSDLEPAPLPKKRSARPM
jgi:c-di-GMP-binding flagellar brake protein YcgR